MLYPNLDEISGSANDILEDSDEAYKIANDILNDIINAVIIDESDKGNQESQDDVEEPFQDSGSIKLGIARRFLGFVSKKLHALFASGDESKPTPIIKEASGRKPFSQMSSNRVCIELVKTYLQKLNINIFFSDSEKAKWSSRVDNLWSFENVVSPDGYLFCNCFLANYISQSDQQFSYAQIQAWYSILYCIVQIAKRIVLGSL